MGAREGIEFGITRIGPNCASPAASPRVILYTCHARSGAVLAVEAKGSFTSRK